MTDKNPFVNVDFSSTPELLEALEKMAADDFTDRSKFIRKLVSQEAARRQQLELPLSAQSNKAKKARRQESAAVPA